MRTMIGKRIGPVPIALVAMLALAAFVSAAFWLAPGDSQTANAASLGPDTSQSTDTTAPDAYHGTSARWTADLTLDVGEGRTLTEAAGDTPAVDDRIDFSGVFTKAAADGVFTV